MFQTIATIAISVIAPIFASCLGIASGKGDEEEKRKLLKLACAFLCGALIGGKPS